MEKFHLGKIITLISEDDKLSNLYARKFDIDFKNILQLSDVEIKRIISKDIRNFMKETFNEIIIKNENYLDKYQNIETDKFQSLNKPKRVTVKRRITLKELLDKKDKSGLTENERLLLYSIQLNQLAVRIHNMAKHDKCNTIEARNIIGGIKTLMRKTESTLRKYGRKGEYKIN